MLVNCHYDDISIKMIIILKVMIKYYKYDTQEAIDMIYYVTIYITVHKNL